MSLLLLVGPAGVGKGSIVSKLLGETNRFVLSVSATTRLPRPGEIDGLHYHFVSESEFDRLIDQDELLEWAIVHGKNRYGTPKSELVRAANMGRHLILEIDVQGAEQVLKQFPSAIDVFIEPPSFEELEGRLRGRATESEDQIAARLATAKTELSRAAEFRHRVINDTLEECVAEVLDLVSATEGKND
jgi:guanylate kinase